MTHVLLKRRMLVSKLLEAFECSTVLSLRAKIDDNFLNVLSDILKKCTDSTFFRKNADGLHDNSLDTFLYICGYFPSIKHGGGLRIYDQIRELRDRGCQVYLFSGYDESVDAASYKDLLSRGVNICTVEEKYFDAVNLKAWLRTFGITSAYFQVIQYEYLKSISLIGDTHHLGRRFGCTFMESYSRRYWLDLMSSASLNSNDWERLFDLFIDVVIQESLVFDNVDVSFFVTQQDLDFTKKIHFAPSKLQVLPTWISPSQIRGINEVSITPKKTVLLFGSFWHSPNVDGLLWYIKDVHPYLREKFPDYQFRVLGDGLSQELINEITTDPSVAVLGWREDLQAEVLQARVCIAPCISGAGIRGKVIQSCALGRPTVVTSLGAEGLEAIVQAGGLVIGDTPVSFSKAIEKFLEDTIYCESVANIAMQLTNQEFSFSKKMDQWLDVFNKINYLSNESLSS